MVTVKKFHIKLDQIIQLHKKEKSNLKVSYEKCYLFLLKRIHPYLWWGKNSPSIKPHSENIFKLVHLENLSLLLFSITVPMETWRDSDKKEQDKE